MGDTAMLNDDKSYEIYVNFTDDDNIDRFLRDVPLGFLPSPGDKLNIKKDGMTYFLTVEDICHFVDCRNSEKSYHSITVGANCESIHVKN